MAMYAIIVGINYYDDPDNRLNGCINDMLDYEKRLLDYGVPTENIIRMSDASKSGKDYPGRKDIYPSKANIVAELDKLHAIVKPGDTVFVSYSGHGTNTVDTSKMETDRKAEAIYTADGKLMMDKEFYQRVRDFKGAKAFVVMDCCHSASMLNLHNNVSKIESTQGDNKNHGYVVMVSGCQDNQTSADYLARGLKKPLLKRDIDTKQKGVRRYRGALTASLMDLIDDKSWGLKRVLDVALSGSIALMRTMTSRLVKWLKKGGFDQIPNMAYEGSLPKPAARGELTFALNAHKSNYPLRVTKQRADRYVGGAELLAAKNDEIRHKSEEKEAGKKRRTNRA